VEAHRTFIGPHKVERIHRRRQRLLKLVFSLCLMMALAGYNTEAETERAEESWCVASLPPPDTPKPFMESEVTFPLAYAPSVSLDEENGASPETCRGEEIPETFEAAIRHYIHHYGTGGRRTFRKALNRSWPYVSMMSDILRSYGLPDELVYVVLVESRFKNRSLSHKGAAGQWQLMPVTARSLGLRVDEWVDERRDPVKSTHAAARYLRRLYQRFHSWPLALAAYNGGQTALKEAILEYGTRDFWTLCRLKALPEEVRCYVPKVFAAITITKKLEAYRFKRPRFLPVYTYDSVRVWSPLELEQAARWMDISLEHLRALNPALRRDRIPPDDESFILRIPVFSRDKFTAAYQNHLSLLHDGEGGVRYLIRRESR